MVTTKHAQKTVDGSLNKKRDMALCTKKMWFNAAAGIRNVEIRSHVI